ncbi:MAG: pyridoxal phosphate-dependent class II aminotransferase [Bacteroidaceae bacterium]|nr:pyridoxal phosphate-dependent class II aminotransferase [Bacteroidaceae bacterium]
MLHGHGDDIHAYPDIRINFSSNVYNHFDHRNLYAHLAKHLPLVTHYPEPTSTRLEFALAEKLHIDASQVMVTNGATEAIYIIAEWGRHLSRAVIPPPTFSEYADACRRAGLSVGTEGEASMIWLCNPNNPTGTVYDHDPLVANIQTHPSTLFVIDASYAPFTREPLVSTTEAASWANVVMLHSMTKRFGVPGLRIGFITAHAEVIRQLRKLQMPWSVNSLAQEAACYLLEHEADYVLPLDELIAERKRVAAALTDKGLIDVHPSHTHILLCRLQQGTSSELKEYLAREHGILIRNASNFQGLTAQHFRIAVQTPAENDVLINAIRQFLTTYE